MESVRKRGRKPSAFKMRDISKVLRAANTAGEVRQFAVDKDGKITVQMGTVADAGADTKGANEWDEVIKQD